MTFIIAKRLDHAQQLLQSGLSVRETSEAVGYNDPFYFSRLYKKTVVKVFNKAPEI